LTIEQPIHKSAVSPEAYRWVVLAVGTLGVFAALGLARFGYSTVLQPMKEDLGISNAGAGIIASANLTGYLLLAVIGGALASRYGTRVVAVAGLLVVGVSMLLTGTATGLVSACVWRGITGLGSGAANVAIMGMWTAWFAPRLRGRAAGVAVAGSSIALMLLGPTVPYILNGASLSAGWRTCWFLFGLAAIGVALLALIFLRDRPAGTDPDNDLPTAKAPPERVTRLYRSPAIWHLGGIYTAFGFSYIIYMTFFIKHLVDIGYSELAAGRLFMLMGACSLVCGFLWGALSDVFGRKAALIAVFLVQTAAFALFGLTGAPAGVIVSAVLFGLTAWSIPAIMAAACGDLLGARLSAAGLGFITLFFGIGQAVAPSVAGTLADGFGSFAYAFLLAAAVAIAGALASLLLPRRSPDSPPC
jgi:MFS family permease